MSDDIPPPPNCGDCRFWTRRKGSFAVIGDCKPAPGRIARLTHEHFHCPAHAVRATAPSKESSHDRAIPAC